MDYERLVTLAEMPEWKTILLDIVYREFDPWDIDISLLAERYLERIRGMDELSVPANAVLVCAILLNMKADILKEEDEEEVFLDEEPVDGFFDIVDDRDTDVSEVVPPTKLAARRVTIDEILVAVEKVITARKKPKKRAVLDKEEIEVFFSEPEEDAERIVEETMNIIRDTLDGEGLTTFSRVVRRNPHRKIDFFLSILHLATDGRVNIWQEKPFDEIFISVVEG